MKTATKKMIFHALVPGIYEKALVRPTNATDVPVVQYQEIILTFQLFAFVPDSEGSIGHSYQLIF